MRTLAFILLLAAPAAAQEEGRTLLDCDFAGEKVALVSAGGQTSLRVGDVYYPAAMVAPGPEGQVGAVFAMLDAGPVMIAVDAGMQDGLHPAEITAAARGAEGLGTRSTKGVCKETIG